MHQCKVGQPDGRGILTLKVYIFDGDRRVLICGFNCRFSDWCAGKKRVVVVEGERGRKGRVFFLSSAVCFGLTYRRVPTCYFTYGIGRRRRGVVFLVDLTAWNKGVTCCLVASLLPILLTLGYSLYFTSYP